jgi:hypothetical protein
MQTRVCKPHQCGASSNECRRAKICVFQQPNSTSNPSLNVGLDTPKYVAFGGLFFRPETSHDFFRTHLARAHLPLEILGGWTEFVPGRQRQSPDMASIFQGLRGAAPRLSQNFFICRRCMKQPRPSISRSTILGQSSFQRSVRFNTAAANADKATRKASPLASLSQTIATRKGSASARKFFPETSSKSVAYWLLGSAASVFGIVVFGGLTRLTESGYVLARGPFRITIDFE